MRHGPAGDPPGRDLVKFAKARPEGTTNEDNYLNAYYFVEETKPVEIAEEGAEQDDTQ